MAYPDGDGNIAPYAGSSRTRYTQDPAERGRSSRAPRSIPADQLHNPASGCLPETVQSIAPYAMKADRDSARREDSHQVDDMNTNRGYRDTSNPHTKVAFTNDSSLDVPGDLTPYANEARTSAARRDADGC
jgi:hypothetical protein